MSGIYEGDRPGWPAATRERRSNSLSLSLTGSINGPDADFGAQQISSLGKVALSGLTRDAGAAQAEEELAPLMAAEEGEAGEQDMDARPTVKVVNLGGLSTFQGVFVPCVLSIFSVILFLRLGYIIGQAGFIVTLSMLVFAYTIVGLTILSISAISTNGLVRGGGAYYMISRSLGPEFGGSIGVIFFFANVFSSALYVAGFVESLCENVGQLPADRWAKLAYGSATLFVCMIVCLAGANAFAKASLGIFGIVMVSICCVIANFFYADEKLGLPCPKDNDLPICEQHDPFHNYTNHSHHVHHDTVAKPFSYTGWKNHSTFRDNLYPHWTIDYTDVSPDPQPADIQIVFALLFNGCTGIMAGANVSGDLKNASKSIPFGTLAASVFTFFVYVIVIVLTCATVSSELLQNNFSYLQLINDVPGLVVAGIFSATLSAALTCLIGASRILQAISKDNLLGDWFLVFSKERGEPVRAVVFSWFCIQCVLVMGEINVIAPLVSMMYLVTYGVVNFACFLLSITGAPNFRPRFKSFTWQTALAGAVGCIAVMFYSKPVYATCAVCLMICLFLVIHFRHIPVSWGDVSQALIYHQVRKYLLRLEDVGLKYWRPQILLLAVNPRQSFEAIRFVNDMKKGGLYIIGRVLVGQMNRSTSKRQGELAKAWFDFGKFVQIKTFADVVIADTVRSGVQSLLAVTGLGGMRPNIVLLGFFREEVEMDQMASFRLTLGANRNILSKPVDLPAYDQMLARFPNLGDTEEHNSPPSAEEYVGIILDTLMMGKNVGILFHMSQVETMLRTAKFYPEPYFIDIWLSSDAISTDLNRRSSELMVQLVWIIHRVKRWKKAAKIRILAVKEPDGISSFRSEGAKTTDEMVKAFVADLRVDASIETVELMDEEENLASLNRVMQEKSKTTCLLVAKLPAPPESPDEAEGYLESLKALTAGLPPTVLFYGVENSTTKFDHAV